MTIRLATRFSIALLTSSLICSPIYAEPASLTQLKNEVQSYHDSGSYEKEIAAIVANAKQYINERAQKNSLSKHPKKLAIVLDIDETSISNYHHMVKRQFIATHEQLHRENLEASSPVLKPMLSLYHDALKHDVTVFFITGRKESERYATAKNLKAAGFHTWAGLYLKPENYNKPSVVPFKSGARKTIENKGYTIIANLGDQQSDLNGGYAEKSYKLPNPYYYLP
jgi:predicted secreted acid phosphatase